MAMENMSQNLVNFFFLIGNPTLNCVDLTVFPELTQKRIPSILIPYSSSKRPS